MESARVIEAAHVIETLSFEVGFAREADAQALHTRYGDFAAGRGLAVIREVFDEVSRPGEVLRLGTLEVDLGDIPPVWDEAEAEARLREALRRALGEALRPAVMDRAGPASSVERAAAELDLVWAHLHHGLLPWPAGLPSQAAFDALVMRVLGGEGPALAQRLRASPAAPRLIARLARQWPQAAIARLAELLSAQAPAGRGPPATAAGTAIPPRAEAWAARLLALVTATDPVADGVRPDAMADALRARGAGPAMELSAQAWPTLIGGEPEVARARLRAAGRDAAWRRRLAALLTPPRRGQLLALWAAPADAAFLQGVLDQTQAWRLGTAQSAEAVGHELAAALVDHLLLAADARLDLGEAVAALVAARAAAEGLAPAVVARALTAGWPAGGRAGDVAARLRALVAARFGVDAAGGDAPVAGRATLDSAAEDLAPTPAALPLWRLDLEPPAPGAEATRDELWRRRLRQAPAGLAAQLRARGRSAAQRRSLARDLTSARLADLLSLWFDPADAAFVEAIATTAEAWAQAAPTSRPAELALRLREWLLAALLLAPAQGRLAADAVVADLLRRRAAHDDLAPAAAARSLIDAWPAGGPAAKHRARLLEALETELGEIPASAGGRAPLSPPEPTTPPQRHTARAALEQAFAARTLGSAASALREALANDGAWLAAEMATWAGDAALRAALVRDLPTALLFALVQPWLSEPTARLLLAASPASADGPDAERAFWTDVLAALWSASGGQAATAAPRPIPIEAAALLRRLLRAADPEPRRARRRAVRAARAYLRDASQAPAASGRTGPPATIPTLATWTDRLPPQPAAAVRRAAAALLVPPAAGLVQLAGLDGGARRALFVHLRPADAPGALAALDALAAAARAAGLPEPAGGWTGFGERVLLRELFEEDRRFAADGFATRGFVEWLARTPPTDAARARRALAAALDLAALAPLPATPAEPSAPAAPEPEAAAARRSAPTPPLPETSDADPDAVAVQPATPPAMLPTEPATAARTAPTAEARAEPQPLLAEPRAARPPDPRVLAEALRAEAADLAPTTEASGPESEPEADGAIYVDNAGMVLAGPYIPMLFERLQFTRGGRFVDDAAVERAVHLLQFMVDGEEVPAPEHRLALNKLLCGLDFRLPLGREFRVADHERETVESLLGAMIERWSIIGRTSVAGLRESFFHRQGALTAEPEAWRLKVEPRAFDMLIDQIPWGFTVQRMPWMAQVLYVDWR